MIYPDNDEELKSTQKSNGIDEKIKLIQKELEIKNCKIYYCVKNNILNIEITDAKFEEKYTKERIKRISEKYIDKSIEINIDYFEYL